MSHVIKDPTAAATKKQTFFIFRLGGGDVRSLNLTRQEASDKIQELSADKPAPEKKGFDDLWEKAVAAGRKAGTEYNPTPMVVTKHASPLDDNSPVEKAWYVGDGACGFAWVNVKPGTSAFAKWLKKNGHARRDSYYGGVTIWISEHNQSVQRKYAHAVAMASVLTEAGFKAYAMERLD